MDKRPLCISYDYRRFENGQFERSKVAKGTLLADDTERA